MIITRHNYEEYFLLYVDNELSMQERRMVEAFVRENGDLEEELNMIKQSVLRPDKSVVFQNKGQLMKKSSGMEPINQLNYAEYFVLYGDDELSTEENDMVEQFVYHNPQYQVEFELIQQARLTPDTSIVFPDKESLYRKEKVERRVIHMSWWKMAAAAVILLFAGGMGWNLFFNEKDNGTGTGQKGEVVVKKTDNPSIDKSNESKSTTDQDSSAPFVATKEDKTDKTKENPNKAENKLKAVERIQPKDDQREIAYEVPEKKLEDASNLHKVETVTSIEGVSSLENTKVAGTSMNKVDASDKAVDLAALSAKMDINDNPQTSFATNNDNELEVLNTSIKKNSSRGFFRKVGRVVGKVTNIGPKADKETDENSKGVRIANFEIALK